MEQKDRKQVSSIPSSRDESRGTVERGAGGAIVSTVAGKALRGNI